MIGTWWLGPSWRARIGLDGTAWNSGTPTLDLSKLGHHLFGEERHGRDYLVMRYNAEGERGPKVFNAVLTLESGDAVNAPLRNTEVEIVDPF